MALVYALIAKSSPDEMRYVGKTCASTPKRRRRIHINEAKKALNKQTYKLNWIRKVLRTNDEILVTILEDNLTEEQSFKRETFLIAHYKSLGHRLTNATDGGEGPSGYKHTEEACRNMSLAQIGKVMSEEACRNMSLAQRRRYYPAALHKATNQEKRQQKALLFSQLSDRDFQSLSKADKISYKYWQRTAA